MEILLTMKRGAIDARATTKLMRLLKTLPLELRRINDANDLVARLAKFAGGEASNRVHLDKIKMNRRDIDMTMVYIIKKRGVNDLLEIQISRNLGANERKKRA